VTEQRALLVVDVQRGFDDPALGPRDNPQAEENIARLIAAWRRCGDPIVIVQHDWPGGPLERGTPGFELKEAVAGEADLRIVKTVHSSLHGDVDLDAWLRERGIGAIAVCGIQTNFAVRRPLASAPILGTTCGSSSTRPTRSTTSPRMARWCGLPRSRA
jgi:nicotinamidase-related amidase